jgi:hypothetical protein
LTGAIIVNIQKRVRDMGVLDNVKEVADLVQKIGDIDLYRKIVHTENEVIELTQQLRAAQQRIRELEAMLSQKQMLTFRAPFYFADGDLVPFCARCWEVEQKPIHMVLEGAGQLSYASYNWLGGPAFPAFSGFSGSNKLGWGPLRLLQNRRTCRERAPSPGANVYRLPVGTAPARCNSR